MAMIRQGAFLVLETNQEDLDCTLYGLDASGGKVRVEETLSGLRCRPRVRDPAGRWWETV
jgi:hypothetical protein